MELEGLILVSREFGYCKITSYIDQRVRLRFCADQREAWYSGATIRNEQDFRRQPLPAGLKCHVKDRGICLIRQSPLAPSKESGVYEYQVEFENESRDTAMFSERELTPIPGSLIETPFNKISGMETDPFAHFVARERFRAALRKQHSETAGIRSLASSRIDLLPHQAFVIGTVIDDPVWRYVLADEVGLGKTIEAGAIAHELLASRPTARVLVLCPGALSRQWLCEMHMSFGGREFRLVDLHPPQAVRWSQWTRLICSLKVAVRHHRDAIKAMPWDLIIVDEAHHLLWNDVQYDLVRELSRTAKGVLLLSAIPARERESDLLRLLQLIAPHQYQSGTPAADRFAELYAAQETIGRRLRMLVKELDPAAEATVDEIRDAAKRLLTCPVVRDDPFLADVRAAIDTQDLPDLLPLLEGLGNTISSRFRISRRIIKNRRSRLVQSEIMAPVTRRLTFVEYEPRPIERDVADTLLSIAMELATTDAHRGCLHGFLRKAMPSVCDPIAAFEVVASLKTAPTSGGTYTRPKYFDSGLILDYEEHDGLLEFFSEVLRPSIPASEVKRLVSRLEGWLEDLKKEPRLDALVSAINTLEFQGLKKVVIFAGTFRTSELLETALATRFGLHCATSFRHDLSDDEKERSVIRFRREAGCRFLVCDESGGEGRNFQFADAVIHYDLPWSVAAVEQRVGRLDRIGRTAPVESVVIAAKHTLEWAWAQCLARGFKVFEQSISGLEFTLRDAEQKVIEAALQNGRQGVLDCIAGIHERCETERAADDADAITDANSFRTGSRYMRTTAAESDRHVEEALPQYFRSMARADSVKRTSDSKDPNQQVWRLQPEHLAGIRLPGVMKSGDTGLAEHIGTFSRTVARDRRDLEFFAPGNALFDAISKLSTDHVRGRTYAVAVTVGDVPPGRYLVVGTRAVLPVPADPATAPNVSRAERHLFPRRVFGAVEIGTGDLLSAEGAGKLYTTCLRTASTISEVPKEYLKKVFAELLDDWSGLVDARLTQVHRACEAEAKAKFAELDDEFVQRLQVELRAGLSAMAGDTNEIAELYDANIQAVQCASLAFDSIGIVINKGSPTG